LRRALSSGDALAGDCAAHDALRWEGRTYRFFVDKSEPSTLQLASTKGWTAWKDEGRLDLRGQSARSIHAFHLGAEVHLLVATSGVCGERIQAFKSVDLKSWSDAAALPDLRSASGHYLGAHGSWADALCRVTVSASRPRAILCRDSVIAELPPGLEALDAFIAPMQSEVSFALIVEARAAGSCGAPQLYFALSADGVDFRGPLVALGGASEETPRQLRVYARARRYWLTTYLAVRDGRERMLWGFIDWEREPARIEAIADERSLLRALEITGLR